MPFMQGKNGFYVRKECHLCKERTAVKAGIARHVLQSYMEDHLKNQDRLDQEWEALAAYQADPCSTSVATDQSNARKNRYSDVLPCESRPLPSSVCCAVPVSYTHLTLPTMAVV